MMPKAAFQGQRPVPAVLVSRPGVLRQSLWASIAACSWLEVAAVYGDGLTTLNQLESFHSAILVVDSNLLDEEADALIMAVDTRFPRIRCLAVANSGTRMGRLLAHGADAVAARDGPALDLRAKLLALAQDLIA